MTSQESFKKRIRSRMAKTGEKYGAARRVLIEQAAAGPTTWATDPEHSDDVIRANTGRSWSEWRSAIEAWPGHTDGHTAIAAWVYEQGGLTHWWAQAVTVGFERITGRRVVNQMADGTFTANRTATITFDADLLRELILDASARTDLFPDLDVELRSKPTSKNLRLRIDGGTVEIAVLPKDDGRVAVTVAHSKLDSPDALAHWKAFWGDWIRALEDA